MRGRKEGSRFRDRRHAGTVLGRRLVDAGVLERFPEPLVVLGLPRGGVPVAGEVARILAAPLDVFLVRKLGVPGHRELAMGAIASGGTRVLNQAVIDDLGVSAADLAAVTRAEAEVLTLRERAYRNDRPPVPLGGATVVVVDDGLATGASMRAALHALIGGRHPPSGDVPDSAGRRHGPAAAVLVAVPVGSPETCRALRAEADEVLCVDMPGRFLAVGQAYDDFSPTTDDEVRAVLASVTCGRRSPISEKSPHRP